MVAAVNLCLFTRGTVSRGALLRPPPPRLEQGFDLALSEAHRPSFSTEDPKAGKLVGLPPIENSVGGEAEHLGDLGGRE